MTRRVVVLLFDECELLDFAGPAQVFFEANARGASYEVVYTALTDEVHTAQGLRVAAVTPLVVPLASDWVIVPGCSFDRRPRQPAITEWLQDAAKAGALVCSVCTGAFLLGDAGLLDGRRATTHWRRLPELKQEFPNASVVGDRLFVRDGEVVTSAGIAAGIDMALGLIEVADGPVIASEVAREMVVYLRRDAAHHQDSVYLDYQTHLSPDIHRLQQWLIANPGSTDSLEELALRANVSPRHLTRVFRKATGITIHEFRTRLRVELAHLLVRNPMATTDSIATACGFQDPRQLRRLYRKQFGTALRPSAKDQPDSQQ